MLGKSQVAKSVVGAPSTRPLSPGRLRPGSVEFEAVVELLTRAVVADIQVVAGATVNSPSGPDREVA